MKDAQMNPDEVTWITDNVAITNFFSAHSGEVIAQHGVNAILCLDRDLEGCPAKERGVECVRVIHLNDGGNEIYLFREAVSAPEFLTGRYGRVVVHCRAGRSRSIAIVAGYLRKALGIDADEAFEIVRSKRESAVAPELIRLVERLDG
jgi:hypothetical protein